MTWRAPQLSSVLSDVKSGFACGDDLSEGVFQFRMNNVTTDGAMDLSKRRRVPENVPKLATFLVEPGDVLFNATNSPELVGKSTFFPGLAERVVFSNHLLRLRPSPKDLDGRFLARWLMFEFQRHTFENMCRKWVNQATVGRESLLALAIPLPALEGQRRIADILDRADTLQAQRREALDALMLVDRSLFLDLFGDPVTNPRGWPTGKLRDLGRLDRGVSRHRPRNAPELLGGPYPLVQTGEVAHANLDPRSGRLVEVSARREAES